jgi:hypothetical protein
MTRVFALAALWTAFVVTPAPARADITAFAGLTSAPAARPVRGFSVGLNLLVLGFEFEYANAVEDAADGAPSLRTGMINGVLQTPTTGTQFYLTIGGGFYRERLGETSETHFGTNIGGGIKFRLAGPVRIRLDYRVFTLRGSPLYDHPQRFYAGLNVSF